jgi:energy-coupling factor transport system permease protein
MDRRDAFSHYHPAVNLLYFTLVLLCAVCLSHPAALLISMLAALAYAGCLAGPAALANQLRWALPVLLLAALVNPLFSHAGVTVLGWFPSGNPLTLESVLYGLSAAGMLGAVLVWCFCAGTVLTTDKWVCLLGRIFPALSLLVSMTVRFVPKCRRQLRAIREGQRCLRRPADSRTQRARQAIQAVSILITWALEDAVETADSMRSRGCGLPGRTAFSVYRWERRDLLALAWLAGCGGLMLWGGLTGGLAWRYYPTVKGAGPSPLTAALLTCQLALCLTPVYLRGREAWQWKHLRSEA